VNPDGNNENIGIADDRSVEGKNGNEVEIGYINTIAGCHNRQDV